MVKCEFTNLNNNQSLTYHANGSRLHDDSPFSLSFLTQSNVVKKIMFYRWYLSARSLPGNIHLLYLTRHGTGSMCKESMPLNIDD